MVSKAKILKKEINDLKSGSNGVLQFSLDDLVMMQMVGNFDGFIEKVEKGNQNDLDKEISKTKETTTTPQLFESIVRKTIESQFAERHITLRELGQNGIDAYTLKDQFRFVEFSFEPISNIADINAVKNQGNSNNVYINNININPQSQQSQDYYVLRVRDYGVGMSLVDLVKDLLIPYNSGKEFDLTKIGEHGIGWYSIVDLADIVKVVTRERGEKKTVQAIVYKKGEKWKAAVKLDEECKGFTKNKTSSGTEVVAYIKADQTNKEQIEKYLHQYLGLVDMHFCKIKFNDKIVNSISELYNSAVPVSIDANGESKMLTMGVSKRALDGLTSDARFDHRDKNLSKLVYTQKGLFVKFDGADFHQDTFHKKAMDDLLDGGLDFWVDLPDNITLTKRRNEVIADESPLVLKAMYDSFEGLFLDVLLNDDDLMRN